MKRLGLLRFIPLWPAIVLILLALFWIQRINIATWTLDQIVIGGDIEDLSITPQRLDLDRSLIDSVSFKTSFDNKIFQIEAEDLEFTYKLTDLTSLALEHIKLGRLKITPFENHSAPYVSNSRNFLLKQLVSYVHQINNLDLPLKSILVQHLELSLPEYDLTIPDGEIELIFQDNRWDLRIVDGLRYMRATRELDKLLFSLGTTEEQTGNILRMEISTPGSKDILLVKADLDTNALGQWALSYPATAQTSTFLQLIEAHPFIEITLTPVEQGYLAEIDADSDKFSFGDFNAVGLRVSSELIVDDRFFEKSNLGVTFGDTTEIVASKIEFETLTATDLRLVPVGRLESKNDSTMATLITGSKLSAASLIYDDISVQSLSVEPIIVLSNSTVEINTESKAEAKRVSSPDFTLTNIALTPRKPSLIRFDSEHGFEHTNALWTLESEIRLGESIQISGIFDAEVSHLDEVLFKGRITTNQPNISLDMALPAIEEFTADFLRNDQQLEATGTLVVGQIDGPIDFSMTHDIDTSTGTARLRNQSPVSAVNLVNLTETMQLEIPDTLVVESGEGEFELLSAWNQEQFSLNTDFALTHLYGHFQEAQIKNMDLSGTLQILPTLHSTENVSAQIESLEYGVLLENISSEFLIGTSTQGELPKLTFENIQGELFNSKLVAEDFAVDLNKPDTKLDLRVQNLDIEQVVATQGIEGLEATGRLDGKLPVTISSEGISIQDGIFWNHLGGGNIVYSISDEQAAALDNPLTDVVIAALRDFRYRVLTAETNYHPNGDLYMNFHLEGISPLLDPDRSVHLNINSEQNVLSLLQSLSYSEGVNKTLDKQIQEKFE